MEESDEEFPLRKTLSSKMSRLNLNEGDQEFPEPEEPKYRARSPGNVKWSTFSPEKKRIKVETAEAGDGNASGNYPRNVFSVEPNSAPESAISHVLHREISSLEERRRTQSLNIELNPDDTRTVREARPINTSGLLQETFRLRDAQMSHPGCTCCPDGRYSQPEVALKRDIIPEIPRTSKTSGIPFYEDLGAYGSRSGIPERKSYQARGKSRSPVELTGQRNSLQRKQERLPLLEQPRFATSSSQNNRKYVQPPNQSSRPTDKASGQNRLRRSNSAVPPKSYPESARDLRETLNFKGSFTLYGSRVEPNNRLNGAAVKVPDVIQKLDEELAEYMKRNI